MNYSAENEKNMIASIKTGDEMAYKAVYLYFYERLCIYVLNFTTARTIAEDIVQEVLLKLWTKRESLRSDGSLSGYLYLLARNQYIDFYRKKRHFNEKLEALRFESLAELVEVNEDQFEKQLKKVENAIEELPPRCKEIFMMSKLHDMRYREIAEKLDISTKTVENQIGKALSSIRKKVGSKLMTILFFFQKRFFEGKKEIT